MNEDDPMKFKQEYLCEFPSPDPRDLLLYEIAELYHMTCDLYDNDVCTGITIINNKVVKVPINYYERRLINKNAKQRLEHYCKFASTYNIKREDVLKAIRSYNE